MKRVVFEIYFVRDLGKVGLFRGLRKLEKGVFCYICNLVWIVEFRLRL